ncbi:MAG: universal stress protein [Dehalococcoidales bacterium]|nr:universal stress protein [Dehalococcoidales bacterium]
MYRKMLVLLDGSKLAEVVCSYALELSLRLNTEIELLHVCSPHESDQLSMRQAYMDQMAEKLSSQMAQAHAGAGVQTDVLKIKAQVKILVGYPAEEILRYAENNRIDLIVLSTHGQSGIRVWDIGNVANKVIHASKVDILMVPTELKEEAVYDRLSISTIIIPLDGTSLSEAVIPHAVSLAKQGHTESEVILINVDDPERQQAGMTNMEQYLDGMVKRLEKEGLRARAKLLKGDTAESIIGYIENNPANLVVMSTHAHKGLTTMVFSSVLEHVLHMVKKAPVLVVKPEG